MTVTEATFRADLPEFADAAAYPPSAVAYWLGMAALMLNARRWGDGAVVAVSPPTTKYDFGTEMFVAHNLVLERQATVAASKGALPGLMTGPVNSKSVGPVSIGYDSQAGIEDGASHWNLTVYGVRFIRLARFVGAGPIQVGVGMRPALSGPAWPGPYPYPWGSGFG